MIASRHSPAAGILIIAIAATLGFALTWAAITEIEQVVRADGQVEPASRVKTINHSIGGRVSKVRIKEGEEVLRGQVLLEFDSEILGAELSDLTARWQAKIAEADRLRAEAMGEPLVFDPLIAGNRPDLVVQQNGLSKARAETRESQRRSLGLSVQRKGHEVDQLIADLGRLQNSEKMLDQQVSAVRNLAEQGLYPRLQLIAAERELGDVGGDIRQSTAALSAARAAHGEAKSATEGFEREWRSLALAELAEVEAVRDQLAEARRRHMTTIRQLVVQAPVDGVVQELMVAGEGQSVGSNQPLMKLVPTGSGLVIRAKVKNRDIGHLQQGQAAKVKVRTFDYLRYGALSGTVETIAADASVDRPGGDLRYDIVIRTESDELADGSDRRKVVPGMAVDVDLLVKERTILSFLTDRIFRLPAEAFQEG